MISSMVTVDKKHTGNPLLLLSTPTTTRTHFCQPTLLLSTKTNMANTTFNDENTLCPSVPRRKGKADLLSTKTNTTNTTCNNAETMEITRTRVAIEIAREIYYKAVFRRGGQPQSAYDETCTFLFMHLKTNL